MKNSGIAIGLVAIGAGLATIGLNMSGGGGAAHAVAPMVMEVAAAPVWYGVVRSTSQYGSRDSIYRVYADGKVESWTDADSGGGWQVAYSPDAKAPEPTFADQC